MTSLRTSTSPPLFRPFLAALFQPSTLLNRTIRYSPESLPVQAFRMGWRQLFSLTSPVNRGIVAEIILQCIGTFPGVLLTAKGYD
ncbi:MAG: hypothetical protein LIQ30_10690, partial [Planctomycetes bacterium]|nr:hypothetical protein [Planctomycetota bacterium]